MVFRDGILRDEIYGSSRKVLLLHIRILPLQRQKAKKFPFCLSLNLSTAASAGNSVRSLGLGFDCGDFSVISVRSSGGIMSRRWIHNPNRCADEYLDGIEDFIEFARRHNPGATRIRCPCRRCNNTLWETIENVGFHLVRNEMIETYSIWNLHREQLDHASSSNATRMDSVEPIVDLNDQVMDII
ncbi:hypothetical protein L3X38_033517 [Prunus dulcis]|uniref:Transposase-associated domain-containing protein n=1 Tax=Prunus dulcis TaxID=3755 RepID=A0AAD4YX12_PRUDU|nr:hypothetical protein L3X38_033517 [Prunus dulcis]